MKRLYVGCRVRIVSATNPENQDAEARIIGFHPSAFNPHFGVFDGWTLSIIACCGRNYVAHPDQLEPIQDPGHEVISWEEMRGLWTPSEVTA